MAKVSEAKARRILREVEQQLGIVEGETRPTLYDHEHEDLKPGCWSITLEDGRNSGWPSSMWTQEAGVFCEAQSNVTLNVYPA